MASCAVAAAQCSQLFAENCVVVPSVAVASVAVAGAGGDGVPHSFPLFLPRFPEIRHSSESVVKRRGAKQRRMGRKEG